MPHGQEKSRKTKKNYKSQVRIGVFEKNQEKLGIFFFISDFFSSNLPNSLYLKVLIGKKLNKNSFKSD